MSKILVIDDDGVVRDALEVFLTRDGHEVTTAGDGANGLQAFKQVSPDLVVMDRDMPVMTGSETLRRIRALSASVPVIMLTGHDSPEGKEKYLSAGATAFLSKKDGLLNALNEVDLVLGLKKGPRPSAGARPAGAAPVPAPAAPGRLALVVDDDASMGAAVARFLSSRGFETMRAEDGASAVSMALAMRPAAVVLDVVMPGKDGVDVLRELAPELPGTVFVMLSGNEDETVARACLRIGAAGYMLKPPDMERLSGLLAGAGAAGHG